MQPDVWSLLLLDGVLDNLHIHIISIYVHVLAITLQNKKCEENTVLASTPYM